MAFYDEFEKFGDNPAMIDDRGQSLSYSELADFAARLSGCLSERSLVFCLCENSAGSAAGYVSFLHNRAVPLLLDCKIDRDLLSQLIAVYEPACLYLPERMREEFPDLRECHRKYGYVLLERQAPAAKLSEELGLLLTTSGSTGSPKLVRLTYQNIQSNAEAIVSFLGLDQTERPVTTLPMNYVYGLSVLNSHFEAGAAVLFTDKTILMKAFWDFMKQEHATSFPGVPFTYELLNRVHFFRMDLPDLRYFSESGGKLSPEMHEAFAGWAREHGKQFIAMYGATEAAGRMAYLPGEYSVEKYGSIGKAIPGSYFTLLDTDGREIREAEREGELMFTGPGVAYGYATCREDLEKGDEWHGSLMTGDIAKKDDEGFYYIVGRKKRFLKIYGNRVNLDEVDRLVKAKFGNIDCASSGVDDRMKTFITDRTKVDEVRQYLSSTTHISESAFDVRYIEEIPKNESGKVLFKKLPED